MKVLLIGSNGMLASAIKKSLGDSINFDIIEFSRKSEIASFEQLQTYLSTYISRHYDFVLNTLASLKPSSKSDYFVTSMLPLALCRLFPDSLVIHCSSINTLLLELRDPYTLLKREAERLLLLKESPQNWIILRLSLLLPSGIEQLQSSNQYKLLTILTGMPGVLFLPPTRNKYKPILLDSFIDYLFSEISNYTFTERSVINLQGKKAFSFKSIIREACNELASGRELKEINVPFPFILFDFFTHILALKGFWGARYYGQQLLELKRWIDIDTATPSSSPTIELDC
jgi:hypothetical protein